MTIYKNHLNFSGLGSLAAVFVATYEPDLTENTLKAINKTLEKGEVDINRKYEYSLGLYQWTITAK